MASVVEIKFSSKKDDVTKIAHDDILAWLAAVGEDAAHTAAEKAPVDTGRLKNSVSWATQQAHGSGDAPHGMPEKNTVYIGSNVPYAPYQEFGTSRGIAGKHFIQFGTVAHANEYGRLLEQIMKQ